MESMTIEYKILAGKHEINVPFGRL